MNFVNAHAGLDAATTQSEKDEWNRWLGLITTEFNYYKNISDGLHVKQDALNAESSQLEASIVANCGGLSETEAAVTDVPSL